MILPDDTSWQSQTLGCCYTLLHTLPDGMLSAHTLPKGIRYTQAPDLRHSSTSPTAIMPTAIIPPDLCYFPPSPVESVSCSHPNLLVVLWWCARGGSDCRSLGLVMHLASNFICLGRDSITCTTAATVISDASNITRRYTCQGITISQHCSPPKHLKTSRVPPRPKWRGSGMHIAIIHNC